MIERAPALIDRHRKPPPQYMFGKPLVLTWDEAETFFGFYRLRRRVQVATSAGVVRSRISVVTYECGAGSGRVYRIDENGKSKEIQPGEAYGEWDWVTAALTYRHGMKMLPVPMRRTLRRPADLVSLQDEATGKWIPATEWGVR